MELKKYGGYNVIHCSINKSYNLSFFKKIRACIDIDVEEDKEIICNCAISAWKIEESIKDKIQYVFATYHNIVVGIYEVEDLVAKKDVIHKYKLDYNGIDDGKYIYPFYPPKRRLEYIYLKVLKGCKTEDDVKRTLNQGNNGKTPKLSYETFKKELLGGYSYEDWLDTYLFKFKDDAKIPKELAEYLGKQCKN